MGLLFVLEGDETAKGMHVDVDIKSHEQLIAATKENGLGLFPLTRRINNYYGDVLYEKDEISNVIKEYEELLSHCKMEHLPKLIELFKEAEKRDVGIETIAD